MDFMKWFSLLWTFVIFCVRSTSSCSASISFGDILGKFGEDPYKWCADPSAFVQQYIPNQCCAMDKIGCIQAESILKLSESLWRIDKTTHICYQNIVGLFYYSCGCRECKFQCGISEIMPERNKRKHLSYIVGGNLAVECEYPWMVKINLDSVGSCGGTLIHPEYVITAAHCTSDFEKSALQVLITSGKDETSFRRGVKEIIQHPEFKYTVDAIYNDISILRLSSPVKFSSCVRPLCLPPKNFQALLNSEKCVATGWGLTAEYGSVSPNLQKVTLPIANKTTCKQIFPSVSEKQSFCAGYFEPGKDVCQGDSGGPLMCLFENKWVLAGVSSFGRGCAQKAEMSAFVKVSNYLPWIKKNIP